LYNDHSHHLRSIVWYINFLCKKNKKPNKQNDITIYYSGSKRPHPDSSTFYPPTAQTTNHQPIPPPPMELLQPLSATGANSFPQRLYGHPDLNAKDIEIEEEIDRLLYHLNQDIQPPTPITMQKLLQDNPALANDIKESATLAVQTKRARLSIVEEGNTNVGILQYRLRNTSLPPNIFSATEKTISLLQSKIQLASNESHGHAFPTSKSNQIQQQAHIPPPPPPPPPPFVVTALHNPPPINPINDTNSKPTTNLEQLTNTNPGNGVSSSSVPSLNYVNKTGNDSVSNIVAKLYAGEQCKDGYRFIDMAKKVDHLKSIDERAAALSNENNTQKKKNQGKTTWHTDASWRCRRWFLSLQFWEKGYYSLKQLEMEILGKKKKLMTESNKEASENIEDEDEAPYNFSDDELDLDDNTPVLKNRGRKGNSLEKMMSSDSAGSFLTDSVPLNEKFTRCPLCHELFEQYYHESSGEHMYKDALCIQVDKSTGKFDKLAGLIDEDEDETPAEVAYENVPVHKTCFDSYPNKSDIIIAT